MPVVQYSRHCEWKREQWRRLLADARATNLASLSIAYIRASASVLWSLSRLCRPMTSRSLDCVKLQRLSHRAILAPHFTSTHLTLSQAINLFCFLTLIYFINFLYVPSFLFTIKLLYYFEFNLQFKFVFPFQFSAIYFQVFRSCKVGVILVRVFQ